MQSSPAEMGFFAPGDTDLCAACWMAWPGRAEIWRYDLLAVISTFSTIARSVAEHVPTKVLVPADSLMEAKLACGRQVELVDCPAADALLKDYGPMFLVDRDRPLGRDIAGVTWRFNGWGNRVHSAEQAAVAATALVGQLNVKRYDCPIVLEGGSVSVDGLGTLIASETSLLNANRNPFCALQELEEYLALYLGARKVIWLEGGFEHDRGDGHALSMARFVEPGRVLVNAPMSKEDPFFPVAEETLFRLHQATDAAGHPIDLVELPVPEARYGEDGKRLPIHYLGYVILNDVVLMPNFGLASDDQAKAILKEQFEDRTIVPVNAQDLALGGVSLSDLLLCEPDRR